MSTPFTRLAWLALVTACGASGSASDPAAIASTPASSEPAKVEPAKAEPAKAEPSKA